MIRTDDGENTVRFDTLENWQSVNPNLEFGEMIAVTDSGNNHLLKCGNGTDKFNQLSYITNPTQFTRQFCTERLCMDSQVMDGAVWVKIYSLDLTQDKSVFSDASEAWHYSCDNRFSRLDLIENFFDRDGYLELMLKYPDISTGYNRWKQKASPFYHIAKDNLKEDIHIDFPNYKSCLHFELNKNCLFTVDSEGTWFGAIGQYTKWNDKIPSANGLEAEKCELWVRIDKLRGV